MAEGYDHMVGLCSTCLFNAKRLHLLQRKTILLKWKLLFAKKSPKCEIHELEQQSMSLQQASLC